MLKLTLLLLPGFPRDRHLAVWQEMMCLQLRRQTPLNASAGLDPLALLELIPSQGRNSGRRQKDLGSNELATHHLAGELHVGGSICSSWFAAAKPIRPSWRKPTLIARQQLPTHQSVDLAGRTATFSRPIKVRLRIR